MAVTHTTTFRNTVADLVDSTLGAGAQLVFRITGSTADAPTTAVATLTFPTPAFGAASNGVITRTAGTMEDTNAAASRPWPMAAAVSGTRKPTMTESVSP